MGGFEGRYERCKCSVCGEDAVCLRMVQGMEKLCLPCREAGILWAARMVSRPLRGIAPTPSTYLKADTPMVRNPDGEAYNPDCNCDNCCQAIREAERLNKYAGSERCCQAPEGFHQPECSVAVHYYERAGPICGVSLQVGGLGTTGSMENVTCAACALSLHLPTCGMAFRDCGPKCPKDRLERAMPQSVPRGSKED